MIPSGFRTEWRLWASPLAYGVGMGVMALSYFASYAYASVAMVTIVGSMTPVFALLFSRILLRIKITVPKVQFQFSCTLNNNLKFLT